MMFDVFKLAAEFINWKIFSEMVIEVFSFAPDT